jgi:hypothetical protein
MISGVSSTLSVVGAVLDQLVERVCLTTLPGVTAMLRPTSNAPGSVWVSWPFEMSLEHVLEALEQALALGLDRPLEHLRIGQREVGRAHRVDEALGREAQLLALASSTPSIASTGRGHRRSRHGQSRRLPPPPMSSRS